MSPKVSIGLPVFNGQKYLKKTINSILVQTYKNFELIISDNLSNDQTKEICKLYEKKEKRIRYVRQKKHISVIENFKSTLNFAQGEYFMWIAADDVLSEKNYIKNLLKKLNNKIDYIFPDVDTVNDKDEIIRKNRMKPFKKARSKFDFAKASIYINSHILYALFKTKVLKDNFLYLEKFNHLKCYQEGLFVHVISTDMKGKFVPEVKKFYRRHNQNLSSVLTAGQLLPFFLEYSLSSLGYFFFHKELKNIEKINLIFLIFLKHAKYICYLTIAFIYQYLKKIFKNILK